MRPIAEREDVTEAVFNAEVLHGGQPLVMRGLVKSWPAVAAGLQGMDGISNYLLRWDCGVPIDAVLARPNPDRVFGYTDDLTGFNFVRDRRPLAAVLEQIWRYSHFEAPPSVAAQSATIADCLPGFELENRLALVGAEVKPRIWFGNRATVPVHCDVSLNIACVAAGRRRFTLFPPEQVGNLYIGPLDFAPANAPISVASLLRPDFDRYPRLRTAMAEALVAELGPGDAIFMPPLWFHQVESLDAINVLVNYWWRNPLPGGRQEEFPNAALWLAALSYRHLSSSERQAWSAMFQHFVFALPEQANAHIPTQLQGLLGELNTEVAAKLRAQIKEWLPE